MRNPAKTLLAVLATAAIAATAASSSPEPNLIARTPRAVPELTIPLYLRPRHGDDDEPPHAAPSMSMSGNTTAHIASPHGHDHSHGQPLLELNETAILEKFGPDPLSYYAHDFQLEGEKGLGGLMIFHIAVMSLAFFVVLPFGESDLKSRNALP
jgi:hypothetical protein